MRDQRIVDGPARLVVGGGIGSGKSTVARLLADRGFVVINADRLGHAVLEPGGAAHMAVAQRWPDAVSNGAIDRAALAAVVFADRSQLDELEAMTHPAIAEEIAKITSAHPNAPLVVELPVLAPLVGDGWLRIWVHAPEEMRIARAVDRGMDEGDARRRADSQPGPDEWRAWADVELENAGSLGDLEHALDVLLRRVGAAD